MGPSPDRRPARSGGRERTVVLEPHAPAIRLHEFLPRSRANGPGWRAVIWVQGCSLACPGCFNPETHAAAGGDLVPVEEIFRRVSSLGSAIEGITVSGGEPLQQLGSMAALLSRVSSETSLSVLLFTGFTWEEVRRMGPGAGELLSCVDVLIAGRYDQTRRLAVGLRGSANKTVHFLTGRYGPEDLEAVPPAEVIVTRDGELATTGIDPVRWLL
jgi:anaerobic ribonucleoside-triphosphate reductase activating protein